MTIIASPKINPEEDGSPRPVQLRALPAEDRQPPPQRVLRAGLEGRQEDRWRRSREGRRVPGLPGHAHRGEVRARSGRALRRRGGALPEPARVAPGGPSSSYRRLRQGRLHVRRPQVQRTGLSEGSRAPPLAPHFSLWIDESRIDDGADHLDEFPTPRDPAALPPLPGAPGNPAPVDADDAAAPTPPSTPSMPSTPSTPTMPSTPSRGVPQ